MKLDVQTFRKVCPKPSPVVAEIVVKYFNEFADRYGITMKERIAAFIAQCAHESAQFTATREYASGAAYEGRKDLGNIYKGDGVRFKGRGYIQLTGRTNYTAMSKEIFHDDTLVKNPELLSAPKHAMHSAMVYWKWRDLNKYADIQFFETITKRINGGTNGFVDRVRYYNILCEVYDLRKYSVETRSVI